MTNHDIEVTVKYCKDCRDFVGDRTSSWLFADMKTAEAWKNREEMGCIRKLVEGKGCTVSIRKYKGE